MLRRPVRLVAVLLLLCPVAAADIQEQRARLPPPASCTDPVEGVWKSHAHYPHVGQWYIFTLTIRRATAGVLAGDMRALYWNGGPADASPPACAAGVLRKSVFEPAAGSIDGLRVTFSGTSWRAAEDFCGSPETAYNLDHFSGSIDPALQEFQSVLNAPGWVDVPTVFRRIACTDAPAPPVVAPPVVPPIAPPQVRTGCGCSGCR